MLCQTAKALLAIIYTLGISGQGNCRTGKRGWALYSLSSHGVTFYSPGVLLLGAVKGWLFLLFCFFSLYLLSTVLVHFLNNSKNPLLFIYLLLVQNWEGYGITQIICPVAFARRLLQNLVRTMPLVHRPDLPFPRLLWFCLVYLQNSLYYVFALFT